MTEPEICPECKATPAPHRGPGVPVRMPGTLHRSDCPTVAWMKSTPESRARLQEKLDAITECERRAWREARDIVIY